MSRFANGRMDRFSFDLPSTRITMFGPDKPLSIFRSFYRGFVLDDSRSMDRRRYLLLRERNGRWELVEEDRVLLEGQTPGDILLLSVRWTLQRFLQDLPEGALALQAGGWVQDNTAVVLCGSSNTGMTTALYHLFTARDRYLSDECVVVHPAKDRVGGFPRPLQLEERPQVKNPLFESMTVTDSEGSRFTFARPPSHREASQFLGLQELVVVFLQRGTDGIQLEQLSQGEGAARIFQHAFHPPGSPSRFAHLAPLVDVQTSFYRLQYQEITDAEPMLRTEL